MAASRSPPSRPTLLGGSPAWTWTVSTSAARLASAHSDRANGLVLTAVNSYLFAGSGTVSVIFWVRNVSNQGVSQGGFLPVLVTPGGTRLSMDFQNCSDVTQSLRPGESPAVIATFNTRTFTGTFSPQSNGGYQVLVSSRLTKIAG